MTVFGWDASDFDWSRGPVDLAAASRDGIVFFTHKSIETAPEQVFRHTHFGEALNHARDVARARDGSLRFYGTYVVVRGGVAVEDQVTNALKYWDEAIAWWRTDPNFFIQVDLERWPYDDVPHDVGERMVKLLEPVAPTAVLLYASRGQYGDSLGPDTLLWNANYPAEQAPSRHYRVLYDAVGGDSGPGWVAYSGRVPYVWQYASDAGIGSQTRCDANAFRGTADDFADLIKAPREDGSLGGTKPTPGQPAPFVPRPVSRWPNVVVGPVGTKLLEVMAYYPKSAEIYVTSGMDGDHGPVSHHYGLTYQSSPTAAIDIGFGSEGQPARGRDVAKWLYDNFSDLIVELIHTTPFTDDDGFYVKNQVRYPGGGPYAGATAAAHRSHVHFATSSALADLILVRLGAPRGAATPAPQASLRRPWPSYMPAGHYFGLVSGPARSHGGYYANERPDVRAIQQRLIAMGYVPGITDPDNGWADGRFEQPTADAVTRFQHDRMPGTQYYGQVWKDDWQTMFTY
jgi:hypothetical protein